MIRINLLPKEVREKGKGTEWIPLGAVVVVLFGTFAMASFRAKKKAYERDVIRKNQWQSELTNIKSKVARVEELDAQKNLLNAKKNTVIQLLSGRLLYPIFMEQFYETLPKDVWISDFKISEDGSKNIAIEAQSNALTIESIADWLQTLESKPERFSGVTLSAIDFKGSGDPKAAVTYGFTMKFLFKPYTGL